MNYRHEFHAGNFADVLKHFVLVRALLYLRRKDKPFRVIDTHAGAGLYDLGGEEAMRSGEAAQGVTRLFAADFGAASELIQPYLDVVQNFGAQKYPGSPLIAQKFLRETDRALFCELLPQAAENLRAALGRDSRVKMIERDGYEGLNAFVPPPERRGLVLIDPPFERRDEYERLFDTLASALRKWPGGMFLIWQPIKQRDVADAFCASAQKLSPSWLRVDLQVEAPADGRPLARTGLMMLNPPFALRDELALALPVLTALLACGAGAEFLLDGEQA